MWMKLTIISYVSAGVAVCGTALVGNYLLTGKDLPAARYGIIGCVTTGVIASVILK